MATIDIILNTLTQFFSWIYSTLGIPRWLLLTITLVIIVVLISIARGQRKAKRRVKKVPIINTGGRPEIIGARLTVNKLDAPKIEDEKENDLDVDSETGVKYTSWGRTIEEWRKATEQNRKLKHAVAGPGKTEEQNKEQPAESSDVQSRPANETDKSKSATADNEPPYVLPIRIEEQNQPAATEITATENKSIGSSNKAKKLKNNDVPLDVKELKAVAELAKRLKRNNRQHQNK